MRCHEEGRGRAGHATQRRRKVADSRRHGAQASPRRRLGDGSPARGAKPKGGKQGVALLRLVFHSQLNPSCLLAGSFGLGLLILFELLDWPIWA